MDTELLLQFRYDYWLLQTVAMMITALLIPKLRITSIFGAFFTVLALAFINSKVWDAALFFQIPDQFSVQAGLLLVANAFIFWLVVKLLPGIEIDGILPALVAPLVFTVTSVIISEYAPRIDWMALLEQCINLLQSMRDYFLSQKMSPMAS